MWTAHEGSRCLMQVAELTVLIVIDVILVSCAACRARPRCLSWIDP